jgi:tetratricopeptide (TPR) repeat protein
MVKLALLHRSQAPAAQAAVTTGLMDIGPSPARHPFDLAKLDYEAERHKKRKKLLLWSLPVIILAGLLALWLILPWPLTWQSIRQYNHKSYPSARSWLTPQTWTSPEPFVAAFDSGTVDTQLRNYARAEKELTRALQLAPENKRCMVLQNLVYALQHHADDLAVNGKAQQASEYTSQANSYMDHNKQCFKPLPVQQPKDQGGGGGGGGGGGSGAESASNQILSATQQQQLEQKNLQGQQSQIQELDLNSANPDSPSVKPW